MAELKGKVQNALDEGRMLILGVQVLVGFQFRAVLEPGFEKLPTPTQNLLMVGLGLLLLAFGLLMWPAAYHRLVTRGEDTQALHSFTTGVMDWAMLPFALALAVSLFAALEKVTGTSPAILGGLAILLVALFFWYGLEFLDRALGKDPPGKNVDNKGAQMKDEKSSQEEGGTKINDKIKHVLTEARMVLPGAQALLGFGFIAVLMEGFDKLPTWLQNIHLGSLSLIGLSIILLMTPAAYHRIVEQGEETEHFHRLASRLLLAAMALLALGLCADFFVVLFKVLRDATLALLLAGVALLLFYGLWFGYTTLRARGPRQLSHPAGA